MQQLQRKLQHEFQNPALLTRALTHRSFSVDHYERLEFLGDSVLNLAVSDLLYLRLSELPESLQASIRRAEQETQKNTGLCVQLAFNYGARLEIIDAVKKIIQDVRADKLSVGDLTEELFGRYLYTEGVPDPDFLIRTSGDQRVSNFLLWQCCYSEFYVTKKCWPDFNKREFLHAIRDYQKRTRRFGGLDD